MDNKFQWMLQDLWLLKLSLIQTLLKKVMKTEVWQFYVTEQSKNVILILEENFIPT